MNMDTVERFEADLIYWREWVEYEEKVLSTCPLETRPYIEKRLSVGKRNITEIEKALGVFKGE